MHLDSINKWLTLAANIGVLAGIIFLGIEISQNSETAELQAAQNYVNLSYELDFRIVDNPSLSELMLKTPENRTPEEPVRMNSWYIGVLRSWENGFYLRSRGVLDDELWSGQVAFMTDLLNSGDELQTYYKTNSDYFSENFVMFLNSLIEDGN